MSAGPKKSRHSPFRDFPKNPVVISCPFRCARRYLLLFPSPGRDASCPGPAGALTGLKDIACKETSDFSITNGLHTGPGPRVIFSYCFGKAAYKNRK